MTEPVKNPNGILDVIWIKGTHAYDENSVLRTGVGDTIDAKGNRLTMAKDSPECERYLRAEPVEALLGQIRDQVEFCKRYDYIPKLDKTMLLIDEFLTKPLV